MCVCLRVCTQRQPSCVSLISSSSPSPSLQCRIHHIRLLPQPHSSICLNQCCINSFHSPAYRFFIQPSPLSSPVSPRSDLSSVVPTFPPPTLGTMSWSTRTRCVSRWPRTAVAVLGRPISRFLAAHSVAGVLLQACAEINILSLPAHVILPYYCSPCVHTHTSVAVATVDNLQSPRLMFS